MYKYSFESKKIIFGEPNSYIIYPLYYVNIIPFCNLCSDKNIIKCINKCYRKRGF